MVHATATCFFFWCQLQKRRFGYSFCECMVVVLRTCRQVTGSEQCDELLINGHMCCYDVMSHANSFVGS